METNERARHNYLIAILRYALVTLLLWTGALKFTQHEVDAIRPLLEKSPIFAWLLSFINIGILVFCIGIVQLSTAILIALCPVSPKLSAMGSMFATVSFLIILSFALTSPALLARGLSVPFVPDSLTQFVITHFVLLVIAAWTFYDAYVGHRKQRS